jgi:hypothetical protein
MPEHRIVGVGITSQLDAAVPERHASGWQFPRVHIGTVRAPHAPVTTGSMRNSMSFLVWASLALLCACNEVSPDDERSTEFVVNISNLTPAESLFATGGFDMPDTEVLAGPLEPGQSYRFDVVVWPGAQLQIVTMFVESNDAFLAFAPGGIALWTPDGEPLDGNHTADLVLYDAGTEFNEPLGVGSSQAPRQLEPGAGESETGSVTVITDGESGAALGPGGIEFPAIPDFVELQIMHIEGPNFRVVLRNVSPDDLLDKLSGGPEKEKPARLSPGIFTVHASGFELFDVDEPATPQLERLAEDADPAPLAEQLELMQGVASDLSGVVWAVHGEDRGLFEVGSGASPGLEDLVEDGRPELLLEQLGKDPQFERYGLASTDTSVIEPGTAVEIRFVGAPGDHFSFVAGYLAANDKFIGVTQLGIPLFDEQGAPRTGELDWALGLFDAGTEVDEPPALGGNQFERQPMRGAGPDEGELVREVHGEWHGWEYANAEQILGVHIDVIPATKINSGP